MKNLIMSLAISAGALMTSGAYAAPLYVNPSVQPDREFAQVRMVCDDYGRCYRTRGGRRVVIQENYGDRYGYSPRERYVERRGYYNSGPSVGVGVGPGGVGVGFGVGPSW